jgi:hypothetical protein
MLGPYVRKYPCTSRIVQDRMNESIEFFLKSSQCDLLSILLIPIGMHGKHIAMNDISI